MDVHLRDLRYFVAVAEELHFTHAAERLHVSQPALSRQIRVLERALDAVLFTRAGRHVSLTPAGETLLAAVPDVLAAWDEAVQAAIRRAREDARELRIGFLTSVAGHLYRDAAARFTGRDELSMLDLLDEPFVALPPGAGVLRDYWLAVRERGGHPVRVGAEAASPDAAFEAVAARQGVALLAAGNAQLYARPGIVSRPVVDLSACELAVAWRSDDDRPVVADFADAALAA